MIQKIEGSLTGTGGRYALVVSRTNEFITGKLAGGAIDELTRLGCDASNIVEVWVPGSYEIPLAAKRLAESGTYAAVICLGCVIRGQTPHFDFIAAEVSKGVAQVGLDTGVPILFGVLTTDTVEQAVDRAGAKQGNKGAEAARAAIEMVDLLAKIDGGGKTS